MTLNVHFSISLADRTLTFAQRVRAEAVDPSPAHAPASHVGHCAQPLIVHFVLVGLGDKLLAKRQCLKTI